MRDALTQEVADIIANGCDCDDASWNIAVDVLEHVQRWLPIETAPKDGTIVALYCARPIERFYTSPPAAARLCLGYYGQSGDPFGGNDSWYSVESREEQWGCGGELTGPMYSTENTAVTPTHWLPLPAIPDEAA